MSHTTGERGLQLIKDFEGLELAAYPDPATGGDPWTIGYGHTGPEVKRGLTIDTAQADALLRQDLAKFETVVNKELKDIKVTQNQFDACVSFTYNCGPANFQSSTLLKKLKAGETLAAADEFLRWNKAAGKVMAGLTRRRTAERELFLDV